RYFDAEAGRWCSPDPLLLAGGINLLAFGRSPTGAVDPLGLLCPDKVAKIPEGPGIYHVEANGEVYTGSAVDLRRRMTAADHPARSLFDDPNAKITIREVDLGDASTNREKNHVLRYFEQNEMDERKNIPRSQSETTNSRNKHRAAARHRMPEYEAEANALGASQGNEMVI
ncbi:MAG TPA: RHS repeat protein, partial [Polyangiaceae bacterium]|nr:RHS repeat protein [Polyangiaceae bacterium]